MISPELPKRLLVFDVEGTLFETTVTLPGVSLTSTIWQAVAEALGSSAVEAEVETHHRWERGEYPSYLDWMRATIDIHQEHGLTRRVFDEIVASARYSKGVDWVMRSFDRKRYEVVIVSGGFRDLAVRAQRDFAIHHSFAACDYLFDESGRLVGYNLLPCDFAGKIRFIELMLAEYQLPHDAWVFVGDGANDAPIAEAAPYAIGYRPHLRLEEVADETISEFDQLLALLKP
jgi:phosphoserine phosphatase